MTPTPPLDYKGLCISILAFLTIPCSWQKVRKEWCSEIYVELNEIKYTEKKIQQVNNVGLIIVFGRISSFGETDTETYLKVSPLVIGQLLSLFLDYHLSLFCWFYSSTCMTPINGSIS